MIKSIYIETRKIKKRESEKILKNNVIYPYFQKR